MCLPAGKGSLEGLEEAIGRPGARILIVSRDSSDIRTHVARSIQGGYYPAVSWLEHDLHLCTANMILMYMQKISSRSDRIPKSFRTKKNITLRPAQRSEVVFLYTYRLQIWLKSSMSASKLRAMIDVTTKGRDVTKRTRDFFRRLSTLKTTTKKNAQLLCFWGVFPSQGSKIAKALIVSADKNK